MITTKIMALADAYAQGVLVDSPTDALKARNDLRAVAQRMQAELKTLNANNAKLRLERDAQAAELAHGIPAQKEPTP